VESAALVKFGYMLEYPCIPRYSFDKLTSNSVREASSDNPSDADNQQERLIGWITGFVDGEGCFSIHLVRQPHRATRRGYKTGFQVAHRFAVTQAAKSVECLRTMQQHFGVGRLHCNRRHDNHKEDLYQFIVASRNDLQTTIIPFFQQYPLRTAKRLDFEKFVRCMQMIAMNEHLTYYRGLLEIAEIMQTMNHCKPRSDLIRILRDYMPDTDLFVGEDIVRSAWRHAG
jgi:LAGLIDADG endonuclease